MAPITKFQNTPAVPPLERAMPKVLRELSACMSGAWRRPYVDMDSQVPSKIEAKANMGSMLQLRWGRSEPTMEMDGGPSP